MKRYKVEHRGRKLVPVIFEDQLRPGSFAHALCHLIDRADLSEFEQPIRNETTGAPAYHPGVCSESAGTGALIPETAAFNVSVRLSSH